MPLLKESCLFIRGIDPKTKRDFRVWCAENNITMTDAIEAVIEDLPSINSSLANQVLVVLGSQKRKDRIVRNKP